MSDPRWGDGESLAQREFEAEHSRWFAEVHGFAIVERDQADEGAGDTRQLEADLASMIGMSPEDML